MSAILASGTFNNEFNRQFNNLKLDTVLDIMPEMNSKSNSMELDKLPCKEELIGEIARLLSTTVEIVIRDIFVMKRVVISQPYPDSFWVCSLEGTKMLKNGEVMSCYFNPEYEHSAWTIGFSGKKVSVAKAGDWAVCIQTKARYGNKAGYNTKNPSLEGKGSVVLGINPTNCGSGSVVLGMKHTDQPVVKPDEPCTIC